MESYIKLIGFSVKIYKKLIFTVKLQAVKNIIIFVIYYYSLFDN